MGPNVELDALRTFLVVCQDGTISGAAQKLFISQPALSGRIRNLERQLGFELLVRSRRGVRPTPAGRLMRAAVTDALTGLDSTMAEASMAARGVTERLSIGVPAALMPDFVPLIVEQLGRAHPYLQPVVTLQEPYRGYAAALESDQLDCAVLVDERPPPANYNVRALFDDPICLVMAADHPLASVPQLRVDDLVDVRFLSYSVDSHFWQKIRRAFAHAPLNLGGAISIQGVSAIDTLVRRHYGLTFHPMAAVRAVGLESDLIMRPVYLSPTEPLVTSYSLCFLKHHALSPALADVEAVALRCARGKADEIAAFLAHAQPLHLHSGHSPKE